MRTLQGFLQLLAFAPAVLSAPSAVKSLETQARDAGHWALVHEPAVLHDRAGSGHINSNTSQACTNCTNLGNSYSPAEPAVQSTDPTVKVLNGTYAGVYFAGIDGNATLSGIPVAHPQEFFLGMPYAKQPIGERRFRRPQRLGDDHSWSEPRPAKRFSEFCYGVGIDDNYNPAGFVTYALGEHCLTVNVIRPAGTSANSKLPVWVTIYGGGFNYGGTADHRLNASWIVDRSVEMGQPIIFASLNYRVHALGFPVGDHARKENVTNLGLYDQRLALHWIKENIAAFGGDPDQITIDGESAGGASVLFHYSAFGGRDDDLFRGAISQSGYYATAPYTAQKRTAENESWQGLVNGTKCAKDDGGAAQLQCLRGLSFEEFKAAANGTYETNWGPVVDGDLVEEDLQSLFRKGKYVKRPLMITANSDEGTSFGVRPLNTSSQIIAAVKKDIQDIPPEAITTAAASALLKAYPEDEDRWPPYSAGDGLLLSGGLMDRRSCAIFGDLKMVAPRREIAQLVSKNVDVYAGRFDQVPWHMPIDGGAFHFSEMAYVYRNSLFTQNALGDKARDLALAEEMTTYWISHVASGNPNAHKMADAPVWPNYGHAQEDLVLTNKASGKKSHAEKDDYRSAGVQLILDLRAGTWKGDEKRAPTEF